MSKIYSTTRALRFGDCDISGTAYFPAYLDMLNGVNEEFFASLGFPWREMITQRHCGTPTVHLSCDFSKPSLFGDDLTFTLKVQKVGRSSLTLYHEILCDEDLRWTATQVLAASDLKRHSAMPWPDDLRAALTAYL